MVMISSVPIANGAASGAQATATPQAVMQAVGAANSGPTGQQLLQTAVIASAMVPQYQEQPKPKTDPKKPAPGQPSSALAAQFLAQTPDADEEAIAIFNPRPQIGMPTQQEAETVEAWQGMQSPMMPQGETPTPQKTMLAMKADLFVNLMALMPVEQRSNGRQIVLQQVIGGKKGAIILTRGPHAYALTAERNTTAFIRAYIEAVS